MEKVNQPEYKWFVVHSSDWCIQAGFEFREDAEGYIADYDDEIQKEWKILSGRYLRSKNINPDDNRNWGL